MIAVTKTRVSITLRVLLSLPDETTCQYPLTGQCRRKWRPWLAFTLLCAQRTCAFAGTDGASFRLYIYHRIYPRAVPIENHWNCCSSNLYSMDNCLYLPGYDRSAIDSGSCL